MKRGFTARIQKRPFIAFFYLMLQTFIFLNLYNFKKTLALVYF